jgi:tRNA(Ile2) C34 agmatinyltransferase TiaS
LKKKIIKNAMKCNNCGDIIESTSVHDFKTCSCGNISVDGGHVYLKRSFMHGATWEDMSEYEDDEP